VALGAVLIPAGHVLDGVDWRKTWVSLEADPAAQAP